MKSNSLLQACSFVFMLSTGAACGGTVALERGASSDAAAGGAAAGTSASAVGAGGGLAPTARHCPDGFALEGKLCAGWVPAGRASCDGSARLGDGRVLCIRAGHSLVYEPSLGDWGPVNAPVHAHRRATTTTLEDGRVLSAGGIEGDDATSASAEIFNPSDGTWHATKPLEMARHDHAAARLPDGRVLVMGGAQGAAAQSALCSAEIFDPGLETWTLAAPILGPRSQPSALAMPDGAVLMLGGVSFLNEGAWLATTATYDPAAGAWSAAPTLPGGAFAIKHWEHTATALLDGSVLVIGIPGLDAPYPGAALLDAARTGWKPTAKAPVLPFPVTSLLPDGRVLVVTTDPYAAGPSSATIYDPERDVWTPTVRPSGWYYDGSATALLDGSVLVVGGGASDDATAERYVVSEPTP